MQFDAPERDLVESVQVIQLGLGLVLVLLRVRVRVKGLDSHDSASTILMTQTTILDTTIHSASTILMSTILMEHISLSASTILMSTLMLAPVLILIIRSSLNKHATILPATGPIGALA